MSAEVKPTESQQAVILGMLSTGDEAPDGIARELSELARTLQAEPTPNELLHAIVVAAVQNVPSADYAGITLVSRKSRVSTPAFTDTRVPEIDRIQYETRQGPCLSAAHEHITIRTDDLLTETRWPEFSKRAFKSGVRSILSVLLFVQADKLGALNVYAREPNAFNEQSEDLLLILAAHAALAMTGNSRETNLRVALGSRDLIGQAKGILMERHKIGQNSAFKLLLQASQDTNYKLVTIAEMVTTTGQALSVENVREV